MPTVSAARWQAVAFLFALEKGEAYSDLALKARLDEARLDKRDAALCTRLCFGVLENQALLDYYIGHYSSVPLRKMHPRVRAILRVGAYQLLFMDKIPPSAAVNEAVATAKATRNGAASGLINAVLRRLAEHKENLPEIEAETEEERLAIRYSHPLWLVRKLISQFGSQTADLLAANNSAPPTSVRVNRLKATKEEAVAALEAEGVSVEEDPWLDSLYLSESGALDELSAFQKGLVTAQDKAAQLASLALSPQPGSFVIDGCAAPGGKSLHMAALMENKGQILSFDIFENKLSQIAENARRIGATCITPKLGDGRVFLPELEKKADFVMADVPCSNLGIIRKKPDIRFKKPEDIEKMPELQLAIMENLSRYVKPGGVMVYATCTILREENEDNVSAFLQKHRDFSLEPFFEDFPALFQVPAGQLTLYPHIHQTDGFFMARLRRKA